MGRDVQFRFPGRVEVRCAETVPESGDIIESGGARWVVLAVEREGEPQPVCMLAPARLEVASDAGTRCIPLNGSDESAVVVPSALAVREVPVLG